MTILNLLWDVDGTLFDTYPALTFAISRSLNELGQTMELNLIDALVRQSYNHCVEVLAQRFILDPNRLKERFSEAYRSVSPANQTPFANVREVCSRIYEHGGVNLTVTHRSVQSTEDLLNAHRLALFFSDIFSVEQGYPRKPDPAMVLAALKKFALNPTETLLIGDREIDIQAGQAGGVHTCLFGKAELTTPADMQIENYNQLLTSLKRQT